MPASQPPKWSRRPAPEAKQGRGKRIALALLVVATLTAGAALLLDEPAPVPAPAPRPTPPPAPTLEPFDNQLGLRFVTLFYADPAGTGLISEIRQRPPCGEQLACLDDLLQALAHHPPPAGIALLPPETRIKAATVRDGTLTVELDRKSVARIPGGVMSELLCLTALANTVAVNAPHLRQIAVTIDGAPAATLKGHIDLSTPFRADFSLVRPAENSSISPILTTPSGSPSQ